MYVCMRVMQTADMAAAPLTVNTDRRYVAEFLEPAFMTFDLAMLMKKSHRSSAVQSISDLNVRNSNYTYGVVAGGSTEAFLKFSDYRHIGYWLRVSENPTSMEEAVRRVRESSDEHPYVLIGEQYMLEYHASQEPCDLVVIRGNEMVMDGEYHLAVRKNYDSQIMANLTAAFSKLNETGQLEALYQKWWIERSQCDADNDTSSVSTPCNSPSSDSPLSDSPPSDSTPSDSTPSDSSSELITFLMAILRA